jgi:UDP-N-acetylglucosamine--N-acetylmuramyl-(pentapeptide) pyrophosphoryl-undecaprenol N-acetylglucosamine transferase
VYPALAAAEAIRQRQPDVELDFVGSSGDFAAPLVDQAVAAGDLAFAYRGAVAAGPLHGVGPLKRVTSLFRNALGIVQAWRILGARRPQALLLTGGWVGLPIAVAARLHRIPALIYLPDIEPGLAIRRLEPLAQRVAVTVADSAAYFPASSADKMVVTGYPLRARLRAQIALLAGDAAEQRTRARAHFGLHLNRPTLLVFGGSRGARTLNTALLGDGTTPGIAEALLRAGIQVLHITGELDWAINEAAVAALPAAIRDGYRAYPYLHEDMARAFAAADLAVCRAGASTLGELPAFRLPAILVPYPFAWRYQKVNADWLAARGAAQVMRDEDMATQLLPTVRALLIEDAAALAAMRHAAHALHAGSDGARALADALLTLAGQPSQTPPSDRAQAATHS